MGTHFNVVRSIAFSLAIAVVFRHGRRGERPRLLWTQDLLRGPMLN